MKMHKRVFFQKQNICKFLKILYKNIFIHSVNYKLRSLQEISWERIQTSYGADK